jgi:photosystem II stability/assembly factor-like uncharacterized protein
MGRTAALVCGVLLASVGVAGATGDRVGAASSPAYRVVLPRDPGAPIVVESAPRLWARAWPGGGWREATMPRLTGWVRELLFTTTSRGWIASADCTYSPEVVLFRTVDSGATWRSSTLPLGVNCAAGTHARLDFADAQHGWMIVNTGNSISAELAATNDGGSTWRLRGPELLRRGDLHFLDARRGWLVSNLAWSVQELARTVDGGRRWVEPHIVVPSSLGRLDPCFVGPPRFVGGTGVLPILLRRPGRLSAGFFETRDDGATWTLAAKHELDPGLRHRRAPEGEPCPSRRVLVRVGAPKVWWLAILGHRREMQVTRDGGRSWRRVRLPAFPDPTEVDFQTWDGDRLLLALTNSRRTALYSSADGGASWRTVPLPAALRRG